MKDIDLKYYAKQLNEKETLEAKHFLYDIYANQLGWVPEEHNPSQWIVETDENGKYFKDLFCGSAQWFGLFYDNSIIASGRLLYPVNGKLEIDLYDSIPQEYKTSEIKRVEMNRIAIDEKHNGTGALGFLFGEMLKYANKTGIDYIFTAGPETALTIIKALNFRLLHSFSYSPDGTDTARCAFFDVNDESVFTRTMDALQSSRFTLRFS